jgi:hypothetical protein
MGTCFIAAMLYTCFLAAALLVPDWNAANKAELDARAARDIYYNGDGDDDDRVLLSSPVFVPMQWKRAHLIWASLVTQVCGSVMTRHCIVTAAFVTVFNSSFRVCNSFISITTFSCMCIVSHTATLAQSSSSACMLHRYCIHACSHTELNAMFTAVQRTDYSGTRTTYTERPCILTLLTHPCDGYAFGGFTLLLRLHNTGVSAGYLGVLLLTTVC